MGVGKTTFTLSPTGITLDGGSTSINLTRDNQSYTNKLLHGYGDVYTFPAGATSYTWKPTAAQLTKFFQEVPAQKTRLVDVYLDTYNGSTKVGRDVHALTVTLSEATGKPTVSGFSVTDSNATANGLGIIVDGKSALTATATPTAKYGATISMNVFACDYNGKHYESYYINDLIASLPLTTTPTSFTLGYKSTDSRGFSNIATLSKTVAKYQAPHVDTFEVVRCNASGTEADNGTKAKVIVKGSWAAMKVGTAYKNPATLNVGYKTKAATSYTYQAITVTGGTVNVSQLLSATLTAGTDYEFSVQLADKFETYSESGIGCSNVKNVLYVSADGEDLVIGTDTGNNVMIDPNGVSVREGSKTCAKFTKNEIELGNDNENARISMVGRNLQMLVEHVGDDDEAASILSDNNLVICPFNNSVTTNAYINASSTDVGITEISEAGMYSDVNLSIGVSGFRNSTANRPFADISLHATVDETSESYSAISMNADNLYLYGKTHVSGGFTEDIPVLASGNCNDLTTTGKYCIGNSGTNRPVNINGWLESKLYSTDYCYQTYTTYQGQTYRRLMSAGTWGSWICTSGDYVIAQGTSGVWTYRRWASGLAECWRKVQYTAEGNKNYGNNINASSDYVAQVNYPFTFSDYPIVSCTCYSPNIQVFASVKGGTKSLSPLVQAAAPSGILFGSSTTIITTIHAIGNV